MTPLRPAGAPRHAPRFVTGPLRAGGAALALLALGCADGPEPDPPGSAASSSSPAASAPSGPAGTTAEGERPAASPAEEPSTPPARAETGASSSAGAEARDGADRDRPGAGSTGSGEASAPSASAEAPEVAVLLRRAERAYESLETLRARFRQTIEVPLMDRRREGHGIWYQAGRDRFRMDFLEPPDDEIVADGEHLWLYYPSTNPNQVIRSRLDAAESSAGTADVLARILEEARTAYDGSYAGRERVAGVPTHVVSLRPLDPGSAYRRVRVWIGTEDHLVRRFEITEANETVRTVTLTELEPDVALPGELFRFEPPADADVFAR